MKIFHDAVHVPHRYHEYGIGNLFVLHAIQKAGSVIQVALVVSRHHLFPAIEPSKELITLVIRLEPSSCSEGYNHLFRTAAYGYSHITSTRGLWIIYVLIKSPHCELCQIIWLIKVPTIWFS